jgi:carboxyl-terminal processing protease
VRSLKTALVLILVSLGFLVGYFAGWQVHGDNVVRLTPDELDAAARGGQLQQRIIEELQGRYYKDVDPETLSQKGVEGMLKALDDPYTAYLSPHQVQVLDEQTKGEYSGIGAALQKKDGGLLITSVFDGSPAKGAGLGPGDLIVAVDGVATEGEAVEASIARIKGKAGTEVTLTVRKKGAKKVTEVALTRKTIPIPQTRTEMLRAGSQDVGYVQLYEFAGGAGNDVRREIDKLEAKGADWIVLDLRFNGGGLLSESVDVTGDFLRGEVVSTKGLHSPLEVYRSDEAPATDLPVVVLTNGYTASASEIVTGALKDLDRATVIGEKTFGKGVVQSIVPLGNGASLKLTTASYYTPDGTNIDKKGIAPDIKAPDDPKTKKDETLDRALAFIAAR